MDYYLIVIIISFLASLVGLAMVEENRKPVFYLFSFFLFITILVENIAAAMSSRSINNIALYNFFTAFEFTFYLFFLRFLFTGSLIRNIILGVTILYIIIANFNIFFVQGIKTFQSHNFIIGCLLVVTFSMVYFYYLFRFPETGSLVKNPFFWLVCGLMFYYTCTLPLYGLQNYITEKMPYYNRVLFFLGDILNIMLYTLFSIGFLCKINFRKL